METILFYGGLTIAGAGVELLLKHFEQHALVAVLRITVSLGLIATISYLSYEHAWKIIHMFGGSPF